MCTQRHPLWRSVERPNDQESVGASRSPYASLEELPPRVPVRRNDETIDRASGALDFYGRPIMEAEGWLERTERVLDRWICDHEERFTTRSCTCGPDIGGGGSPGKHHQPRDSTWDDFLRAFRTILCPRSI
ncbi:hypothetical protein K2173_028367 [Erythroxylum novogranatense]|uniref:Uncharacterized protein n=1 Tax=Erythroxylum novogranatense TaxID=1862640 RepID=A0AAV8U5E4_9ROSI|nr:hypothetical protein K2173_028367 [Erythroxylum novogranatense]